MLAPSDSIDNVNVVYAACIPANGRIKKECKRTAIDSGINVKYSYIPKFRDISIRGRFLCVLLNTWLAKFLIFFFFLNLNTTGWVYFSKT